MSLLAPKTYRTGGTRLRLKNTSKTRFSLCFFDFTTQEQISQETSLHRIVQKCSRFSMLFKAPPKKPVLEEKEVPEIEPPKKEPLRLGKKHPIPPLSPAIIGPTSKKIPKEPIFVKEQTTEPPPVVENSQQNLRTCRKCNQTKTLEEFSKDKKDPLGKNKVCRICTAAASREYLKRLREMKNNKNNSKSISKSIQETIDTTKQPSSLETKQCGKCKKVKKIHDFSVDRSKPSGLRNTCRDCVKIYNNKRKSKTSLQKPVNNTVQVKLNKPILVFDL